MAACAGVWLLASACGPGVATPMPEPPTVFDLTTVGPPRDLVTVSTGKEPDAKTIRVYDDRLPTYSTVRVTNLDRSDPTVAVDVPEGRGADLIVSVTDGEELRFEAVTGELRSEPADAIFVLDDPVSGTFHLAPAQRFACLKLEPGYRLELTGATRATLSLENGCARPITLDNARSRLALPDFTLDAALPIEVPAAASTELTIELAATAPGVREDVLFVDVTLDDTTLRYPFTLRAE
jgi:hypothetical protein